MRIVPVNEKEIIYINGSALTPFFYREEFNRDFLVDLSQAVYEDTVINFSLAHKILWALAKTHDFNTVSFDQWSEYVELKGTYWTESFISEVNQKFQLRKRNVAEKDDSNIQPLERYELSLLANALRMELPLELLKEMSIDTLIDYQEIYIGEGERKPRQATQEDIDAWFG